MNPFRRWSAAAVFLALALPAFAAPAEIIFIRHAEKPAKGPELNARGWERAKALARLFAGDARVLEHGRPVAIFSGAPAEAGGSVRSIQTMEETSRTLQVAIDRHVTRDEIGALVKAVMDSPACAGKTVIVCWEHKRIPKMLPAFGWKQGPSLWGDEIYDRLWILDFDQGKPVRFRDLPQRLLPGDSER